MFDFFSPSSLFVLLNKASKLIRTIILPLIIVSLIFSLFLSPEDYIQGDAVKLTIDGPLQDFLGCGPI